MRIKREHAAAIKKDLEEGLEKWRQQVREVQESNMKRAEDHVEEKFKLRRQRSREERRSREKRVMERRKESKEREEEALKMRKDAIASKDEKVRLKDKVDSIFTHFPKVDSLLREREESIERQRRLAAKTATMRRKIR